MSTPLPIVVIGAGPVGLAAALHLHRRGLVPKVLEAGDSVGTALRQWGHVRMFSPWQYNVDPLAEELLRARGWTRPEDSELPTGREMVEKYLEPLAALPELAPHLAFGATVTAVSRRRHDRMKDAERAASPFVVRYVEGGTERELLARAVIDASGTWNRPNPAGAAGIPALGERALAERIRYGIPDLLGPERPRYQGKRILVIGSGHSAFNLLTAAARLRRETPATEIHWAIRRPSLARVLGGGEKDQLAERGRLGQRIGALVDGAELHLHVDFHLDQIVESPAGLVACSGETRLPAVDEIIVATGFRPDLAMLAELRLGLDPGTESPTTLAPMIDPNLHSCGTVRPHGAAELKHPEPDFYLVGMKSYGRAPTFLLRTGYEQVRSVAAALAGDWEAARRVELVLPETGVCNTGLAAKSTLAVAAATGCCGGAPPAGVDACCAADATAKSSGAAGCGCS